jgi:hypothetical protein
MTDTACGNNDNTVNNDLLAMSHKPYKFGTLSHTDIPLQTYGVDIIHVNPANENNHTDDTINEYITDIKGVMPLAPAPVHFFSGSEANLCLQIMKAVEKQYQTMLIELPAFAQDTLLVQRIGDYIKQPHIQSVVIDAKGRSAMQIIKEHIKQLSHNTTDDNIDYAFASLMTFYAKKNIVLYSVIYNAQFLKTQDFDYLYKLKSLIHEKFSYQTHHSLMRFIFIGDKYIAPILQDRTKGNLKQFFLPALTHTECVNALYLHTPVSERTELFYQTVGTNAAAVRIATAGYPALLRHVLPLPIAPSLADRKNPTGYLSKIINSRISDVYHTELSHKRTYLKHGNHYVSKFNFIKIFLLVIVIIGLLGYFTF